MIIVSESAVVLKGFLAKTNLSPLAQAMLLRLVLAFTQHRGRMSCSQAAGSVASDTVHRGELTRFLARPRWQKHNRSAPLWQALLALETKSGEEDPKHLQHGQPRPAEGEGPPLQQEENRLQEVPQLHVWPLDHAVGHAAADAAAALHPGILHGAWA
jgi:hypothetical protein